MPSICFLCGGSIRRQLGFNPGGLTSDNRRSLRGWQRSLTRALCQLLDVSEVKGQTLLESVEYCFACHELLFKAEFLVTTIASLQGQLQELKGHVKGLVDQHSDKARNQRQKVLDQIRGLAGTQKGNDDTGVTEGLPISHVLSTRLESDLVSRLAQGDTKEEAELSGAGFDEEPMGEDFVDEHPMGEDFASDLLLNEEDSLDIENDNSNLEKSKFEKIVQRSSNSGRNSKEQKTKKRKRYKRAAQPSIAVSACSFCSKRFSSSDEVAEHELLHASNIADPFFCVLCPAQCTSGVDLRSHVISDHERGLVFRCHQCLALFKTEKIRRVHLKTVHFMGVKNSLRCTQCPFRAVYASTMKNHARCHGERAFRCEIKPCGKSFHSKYTLKAHQGMVHGLAEPKHSCLLCDRAFHTRSDLRVHQKYHGATRPYICEQCSAAFKTVRTLQQHARVHQKTVGNRTNVKLRKPRKSSLSDSRFLQEADIESK